MLGTSIGIVSWKKFDITLSTRASRYVNKPFTTLAEPKKIFEIKEILKKYNEKLIGNKEIPRNIFIFYVTDEL